MAKSKNTTVWTLALLEETFGLQKLSATEDMPLLTEWLASEGELSDNENITLNELRLLIIDNVDDWDEEDLKMNVIVFILKMANYVQHKGKYRVFFDKFISATIDHHTLSSRPDMMLAKGVRNEVRTPYFCFHECLPPYSPQFGGNKGGDKDPRGQLLQDMLIAQTVNGSDMPIYGCYVTGRHWYFVVLIGSKYKISRSYDTSLLAELEQVVFILRHFWDILEAIK